MKKVYQVLAEDLSRLKYLREHNVEKTFIRSCEDHIKTVVQRYMPVGSGFDAGTDIDMEKSTNNKLVFHAGFHHMDTNGFYTRWTFHDVIVTPHFSYNTVIRVTGRDYLGIKEYITEMFDYALEEECE